MRFGRKGSKAVLLSTLLFRYTTGMVLPGLNIHIFEAINPIQYGLFFKTLQYGGGGGALWPPLVTLLFLKVEQQNLVRSGILMCFLQKWH